MEAAKQRGEKSAESLCAIVDANGPERETIANIERIVRHGYNFINLTIRKDGVERTFEADWLARLLRAGEFAVVRPDEAERT